LAERSGKAALRPDARRLGGVFHDFFQVYFFSGFEAKTCVSASTATKVFKKT
jgi:hypothetical protein